MKALAIVVHPGDIQLHATIDLREKNGVCGGRSLATRRATLGTSLSVVRMGRPVCIRNRRRLLHAVHLVPALGKPSRLTRGPKALLTRSRN